MGIEIRPAKLEEADEMVQVGMKAFEDDGLLQAVLAPDITPQQKKEYDQWRLDGTKMRMETQGSHYFIAVDDSTGSIVGYTGFQAPGVDTSAHLRLDRPDCMNLEIDNDMREKFKAAREKWIGGREDVWYVQSMCVHPDMQGHGIGKRLLQRGVEEADKAGQDVYLEGTAAAQALYKRCGFEVLDEISLLDGNYVMSVSLRRYQSPTGA